MGFRASHRPHVPPTRTLPKSKVRIGDNTATDGLARSRAPISNPLTCVLVTRTYLEVHPG